MYELLLYIGIFFFIYGSYRKYRDMNKQKMEIITPLLNQNIAYKDEFVQGLPSEIFGNIYANSDPWINRFSLDRQPRDLMEKKKEQEKAAEAEKIRNLVL